MMTLDNRSLLTNTSASYV